MTKVVYTSGLRFIALLLIQVLILSNINIHQIVTPYFYILFVLMLPVHLSMSVALLSAFVMGISIDMFLNGGGIHAASAVFIAFIRPAIFQVLNPPGGGYENSEIINVKQYGAMWVLVYSSILVLIHHFLVFYLEVFTFDDFFFTIAKVIASSALTVVLILIYQFLFFSRG